MHDIDGCWIINRAVYILLDILIHKLDAYYNKGDILIYIVDPLFCIIQMRGK